MPFTPRFQITAKIANALLRSERAKEAVLHLPITSSVLANLRETARLHSTHYSTKIEGNRLTQDQITKVVEKQEHFPGRERDEKEVLGYYAALEKVEQLAATGGPITERQIQILHALVMAAGRRNARPTSYRSGQNVIRESRSRSIVYMPPEAKDVRLLMKGLAAWINTSEEQGVPCLIRAGITHYQFATIHPYYDGNGRTARLLTTLILHLGGYDLKGLYSLEEYYARNLSAYYEALTVGPSHNYYLGRAESDITGWVEYFCDGVSESFGNVERRAREAASSGEQDHSTLLRRLDPRQRKSLELFMKSQTITSADVGRLFAISQRAARDLLTKWSENSFVTVVDPAKKSRKYALSGNLKLLLR